MLKPAQLAQLCIAGFRELSAADGAFAQAEEPAATFVEADRPLHPAAPAQLGVELVAQPLQVAGGEQLGQEKVAAQLGPAGAAGEYLGTDQFSAAHQPVAQQQFQVEHGPRFVGGQQPAIHQHRLGPHQGRQHRLGIWQLRVAACQVAAADQAVGHRQQASFVGQLYIWIYQVAQGLQTQFSLQLLPALLQGLVGGRVGQ